MLKNQLKLGLFVISLSCINVTIHAADSLPVKSDIIGIKTRDVEVEKDDYVRITQPLPKEEAPADEIAVTTLVEAGTETEDEIEIDLEEEEQVTTTNESKIRTFDSEINIMGEASMGTEITIFVYYGDFLIELEELMNRDEYKLKTVGATETFNQLITLKEGLNHVMIQYHFDGETEHGTIEILIDRMDEKDKEMIKSFVQPEALTKGMTTP